MPLRDQLTRKVLATKTTDELLEIWKDRETYPEETVQVLRNLLYNRGRKEQAQADRARQSTTGTDVSRLGDYVLFAVVLAVFLVVAIGWVANGLMGVGASPMSAIVSGIALFLLTPTGIGGGLLSVVIGRAYGLPDTALIVRMLVGYLLGVVGGAVLGVPFGYLLRASTVGIGKVFSAIGVAKRPSS